MREKILRLFELTHATDTCMSLVDLLLGQMQEQYGKDDPEFTEVVCARIRAVVKAELPTMIEKYVQLYAETYNESEIDAMIVFHDSPVGRKIEAMSKPLQAAGAAIGASIGDKVTAEIHRVVAEFEAEEDSRKNLH